MRICVALATARGAYLLTRCRDPFWIHGHATAFALSWLQAQPDQWIEAIDAFFAYSKAASIEVRVELRCYS